MLAEKSVRHEGCLIWEGGKEDRSRGRDGSLFYGFVKIKIPMNDRIMKIRVHRLSFFLHNSQTHDLFDIDQVSHLCHNSLCIDPNHLSREPAATNNQRKSCNSNQNCTGHEPYPDCIFH